MKIPESVIRFLEKQSFVFVGTVADDGMPNVVPKGVSNIDENGIIYIVDLFSGRTKTNIEHTGTATVAYVDERHYAGFQVKGNAQWIPIGETDEHKTHLDAWRKKVAQRITNRVIKNLQTDYKTHHHEAHFRDPQGVIVLEVSEIINLAEPMAKRAE